MATYSELQDQLAKVRQEYGQRLADYPNMAQNIRTNIYGGDKVLPTLRSTRDSAIMQLYDVDKRLAERYANPQSSAYVADPYAREKLAAEQHQSVLGTVSGTDRLVQSREEQLGNLLDKSLEILKLNLTGKSTEHSMLIDELNAALKGKEAGATGGLDPLALLALLNKQKTGSAGKTFADLTGPEKFKARVLSGAANTPAPTPPSLGIGDRAQNLISSIISSIPGQAQIPLRTIPSSGMSVNFPDVTPSQDVIDKILALRPEASPSTDTSSALTDLGIGNLAGGAGGTDNLALLQYISGASPKYANEIAQKLIEQKLFPKASDNVTDVTAPANRVVLDKILDKVVRFSQGTDDAGNSLGPNYTALQFYQDIVRTYPEVDAESIRKFLATVSPLFLDLNL